jgi:hypothetical protein
MHNSQNGVAVAQQWSTAGGGSMVTDTDPNPALIRYGGCVACHTKTSGTTCIGDNGAPVVFNSASEPTEPLAGGNFYWMRADSSMGHNVSTITATADPNLGRRPPGNTSDVTLMCAGTSGCHGNPAQADEFTAIKGSHHAPAAAIDGTTVAKSYRFLGIKNSGTYYGVLGTEDSDWERTTSATKHNEYKATSPPSATNTDSISSLCGRCHGHFHDPAYFNASSPHLLHPTDVCLPDTVTVNGATADSEYHYYDTYNPLIPVGRQNLASIADHGLVARDTGGGTGDCVICLSCHRAHGSPNWKMLRWDYRTNYNGAGSGGCSTCHTYKD